VCHGSIDGRIVGTNLGRPAKNPKVRRIIFLFSIFAGTNIVGQAVAATVCTKKIDTYLSELKQIFFKNLPPDLIKNFRSQGYDLSAHFYTPIKKSNGSSRGEVLFALTLYEFSTGEKMPLDGFTQLHQMLFPFFCNELGIQLN